MKIDNIVALQTKEYFEEAPSNRVEGITRWCMSDLPSDVA
jgi:hypothetical protein